MPATVDSSLSSSSAEIIGIEKDLKTLFKLKNKLERIAKENKDVVNSGLMGILISNPQLIEQTIEQPLKSQIDECQKLSKTIKELENQIHEANQRRSELGAHIEELKKKIKEMIEQYKKTLKKFETDYDIEQKQLDELLHASQLKSYQFEPKYDFDFTHINDTGNTFLRGGLPYTRPVGSKRFAITVLGKYGNNHWIECSGKTGNGEWPVAFHGTQEATSIDFAKNGFDVEKCKKVEANKALLCTPDPNTARKYGRLYIKDGVTYNMIFQMRVDPSKIDVVRKADSTMGEFWTVPRGASVRPYGLCCYPANSNE
ncbi:unnamed protein product [Caenorhabditis bovis]|uniref:Uncharacterized protein n=1 Tax=Caenorhabditis bovis TaxID=2654633 RepID=A0A8S1EX52_9PELO|nr:unnamed protein product [Caenorhabditis bovis]